jgi:hypothetical protein
MNFIRPLMSLAGPSELSSLRPKNHRPTTGINGELDILNYLDGKPPHSLRVKWTPLSRPILARNKLMPGGVLGLSVGGGDGSPPLAIPALESALGSHPCGALSSVQVPPV